MPIRLTRLYALMEIFTWSIFACTLGEPTKSESIFLILVFPLLGDDLYGGSLDDGIQRQALHCHYLSFYHPFLEQDLQLGKSLAG